MNKFFYFILIFPYFLFSQNDSLQFQFSGFADIYYKKLLNDTENQDGQFFQYNHNRENEFNVNMALLRSKISYKNTYAQVALQAGTYVEKNYAAEKTTLLNEAFVGMNFNEKHNIEVGILPSYIGFESATTKNNFTLTRSMVAENSPYYFTGAKYIYTVKNIKLGVIVSNGWQNIQKSFDKSAPSFGTKLEATLNDYFSISWNTYMGEEQVNDYISNRYFSNLYSSFTLGKKTKAVVGFDIGMQKINDDKQAQWYAPIVVLQHQYSAKNAITLRLENYTDKDAVFGSFNASPSELYSWTLNHDLNINNYLVWRFEIKQIHSKEGFFDTKNTKNNLFYITTGLNYEL